MSLKDFIKEQILVLDTETTGVDSTDAIIEFCASFFNDDEILTYTERYNTSIEIPAIASSIHFITNEDLVNSPSFKDESTIIIDLLKAKQFYVGHNVIFDRGMMVNEFERLGSIPSELVDDANWICTLKMAKKLYAEDESFENFKLSYLWFKLGLNKISTRTIVPHSAEDDVYMCLKVFEHLAQEMINLGIIDESGDIAKQITDYISVPVRYKKCTFGKHKGELMKDVPLSYIKWMITNSDLLDESGNSFDADIAYTFLTEYEERGM